MAGDFCRSGRRGAGVFCTSEEEGERFFWKSEEDGERGELGRDGNISGSEEEGGFS